MKKQLLLCIDLIARLQNGTLKVGESHKGVLVMTQDQERVEFDEQVKRSCERNPKVWEGKHLNVHKNRKGEYVMNFKHLVLTSLLDPYTFADEVFADVERAKVEIGL